MSDADYKRLGCVADGCTNDAHIIKHSLCTKHYQRQRLGKPLGSTTIQCQGCGASFSSEGKRKYCTPQCGYRHRNGCMTREDRYQLMREQSANSTHCMTCGKWFWRDTGGSNKKRGIKNKFCSRQCRSKMQETIGLEKSALVRIANNNRLSVVAVTKEDLLKSLIKKISELSKAKAKIAMRMRPCAECGKPVGYTFGRSRIFCSRECAKQNANKRPEVIEQKKAARKRRKALERGARVGKSFSYRQVFERDGWKCQMCGCKTPEAKRGTLAKNAPELDHIQPLSKGGTHSLDNAQTLCRSCNAWKSNKIIPAQQGLFTGHLEAV